jgi:predicted NUDIX family phosphoesterase
VRPLVRAPLPAMHDPAPTVSDPAPEGSDPRRELVLGLPRTHILGDRSWTGIRDTDVGPALALITAEGEYRPRDDAEEDPTWKQVIPYLLLRDRGRIFLMRRTSAGGDARLHERWSIGVGGHLGPGDEGIEAGLRREFHEELVADWQPQPRLLGLLNDDRTAVGRVHLGVVFEAEAAGRAVAVRETHKLSGAFADAAEVQRGYEWLETWSQLLFDFVQGRERP